MPTRFLRDMLVNGMLASLLSTAVLAWRGRAENAAAAAPLNAPAHWFFGRESLRRDGVSMRHTATGFAVHHMSSLFWAALYGVLQARHLRVSRSTAIADAAAVTVIAAVVDLNVVPERLTPGFERRLSRLSLLAVYGAFGVGLASAALWRPR